MSEGIVIAVFIVAIFIAALALSEWAVRRRKRD